MNSDNHYGYDWKTTKNRKYREKDIKVITDYPKLL